MGRAAMDAVTLDIVKALTDAVERIAAEKTREQMAEATQRIVENLPALVYLPPMPAEHPEERILSVKQVAAMLGCSPRAVQMRMDRGELVYVLADPSSNQRKMPYSWVVEYIHDLPRYTGKVKEKKEVKDHA